MASANKFILVAASLLALAPAAARADDEPPLTSPADPSEAATLAETLFQDGKRLLEQGAFVEACTKLAQSDALDPAIGTLGLLAACHEQEGRTATAWREYGETARRAEAVNDERGAFARQRASALEPELPRLLVRLPKGAEGAAVFRNGVRLAPDELGVAQPIDPGTYEIVARLAGRPEFRATVTAQARKVAEVEIPDWNRPAPVEPAKKNPAPSDPGTSNLLTSKGLDARKVGALVAGGVGFTGLAVAGAFALSASSRNAASVSFQSSCTTAASCARGRELREDALRSATVANVAFGMGAASAVTALVLVLLPERTEAPKPAPRTGFHYEVAPFADRTGGGALLIGNF
ncbi:hypothetical protein [Polyangium sorediatum]|uniref:PEGA domain-containing protein n=1 Tax=Polyangium sorediatum TaxID=889274 RepID=A0ABT6P8U6_9BACT|nr:hypothetical protein [Polyangium sorediatum]MDI1437040.1 hypothetical protein [Polyangium sorediatum]